MRWLAPNGTQWLRSSNQQPWLPPGWIGHHSLGFAWMHRCIKTITNPANPSNLKRHWTCSIFHCYGHLTHFISSLGLEDVTWHMDTLSKYTVEALNDTQNNISLLNTEVTQKCVKQFYKVEWHWMS